MFQLIRVIALLLKRRSYIKRLTGILLHLHRADFDTYAFLMPLFCFDSATCWILGVDSFFPLRLYILLSFSRAWLRSFMPCTGGFRASDNVNTGGVLGYGTVLFPQLLLAVFSRCSMEMNFVFFFYDSDPSLSFTLVERLRCFCSASLLQKIFFSCRSLNLGAWIWDIIMGTKSFGAFTALHSLCTMLDLMTFAFGI